MTPLDFLPYIVGLGGPISAIIIAYIVDRRTHKTNQSSSRNSERAVEIDEKEAHTHEVSMIIEGFTQSLESLRTDLTRTQNDLKTARGEIDALRTEQAEANRKIAISNRIRAEMMLHIMALEAMVPNPPGPPTRPLWSEDV